MPLLGRGVQLKWSHASLWPQFGQLGVVTVHWARAAVAKALSSYPAGGELRVPAEELVLPSPPGDPPRRALPGDAPGAHQQHRAPRRKLLRCQEGQRLVGRWRDGSVSAPAGLEGGLGSLRCSSGISRVKAKARLSLEARWLLPPLALGAAARLARSVWPKLTAPWRVSVVAGRWWMDLC